MPFYEYQCNNCGHALEAMQKVSDPPLKKCPDCGKPQLQKLMSAPVFRLKGGGWYETDFKSDQDNKRNLADRPEDSPKEEKPKEEKKEGAAAESKEAPAADAKKSEKPAEKPVEKTAAGDSGKKTAARASQGRPTAAKSHQRKAAKRPSRPAIKRGRAKPARGR
jgi:putative FmdB family regulatory protein